MGWGGVGWGGVGWGGVGWGGVGWGGVGWGGVGWGGVISYGAQVARMPAVVWFSRKFSPGHSIAQAEFGLLNSLACVIESC